MIWPRMNEFGTVHRWGEAGGQPRPHPKGAGPASPKFWHPYVHPNGLTWSDGIWYNTRRGSSVFLQRHPRPNPKWAGPQHLQIFRTSYMCTYGMRNNNIASLIEVDERQIVTHSTTNQQLTRDLFAVTNLLANLSCGKTQFHTYVSLCIKKVSFLSFE